jgi:hypothetical protein
MTYDKEWYLKEDTDEAKEHRDFLGVDEKGAAIAAPDIALPRSRLPLCEAKPEGLQVYETGKFQGAELEAVMTYLGGEIDALAKRVKELESREWVGVWQEGKSYAKGAIISHDGSAWTATRAYPEGKPGTPNSGWRLFVKRGRDGKEAKQ